MKNNIVYMKDYKKRKMKENIRKNKLKKKIDIYSFLKDNCILIVILITIIIFILNDFFK